MKKLAAAQYTTILSGRAVGRSGAKIKMSLLVLDCLERRKQRIYIYIFMIKKTERRNYLVICIHVHLFVYRKDREMFLLQTNVTKLFFRCRVPIDMSSSSLLFHYIHTASLDIIDGGCARTDPRQEGAGE
jgi:hypothetical protein